MKSPRRVRAAARNIQNVNGAEQSPQATLSALKTRFKTCFRAPSP